MCQQHPQFLTAYRLHVHRTVKPSPHHLRNTARIVAVRLVDLRLQHRLHVPRLDADHRQSCFGESAEQPLRQRSSFQPNSLEVVGGVLQHRQQRFKFARHLYFPNDLACVIHNADARLLDRNVQSSKMVHAALLLLMLEAVFTDLVSPSARSAAPKIFSYPQAAGRLPHLLRRCWGTASVERRINQPMVLDMPMSASPLVLRCDVTWLPPLRRFAPRRP